MYPIIFSQVEMAPSTFEINFIIKYILGLKKKYDISAIFLASVSISTFLKTEIQGDSPT